MGGVGGLPRGKRRRGTLGCARCTDEYSGICCGEWMLCFASDVLPYTSGELDIADPIKAWDPVSFLGYGEEHGDEGNNRRLDLSGESRQLAFLIGVDGNQFLPVLMSLDIFLSLGDFFIT